MFYTDFLGMQLSMDMGWILTFSSPDNPTAQVTVIREEASSALQPDLTVEVADVDEIYTRAVELGLQIVYPLTGEPWGVRRFFVVDPNGKIINIMSHPQEKG
jgi:uncharacterized glyoxalase superfamily protein PhnB